MAIIPKNYARPKAAIVKSAEAVSVGVRTLFP